MKTKLYKLKLKDIEFIFQFMMLKSDVLSNFSSLYVFLNNKKEDFFNFVDNIEPGFSKHTDIVYIIDDLNHNSVFFEKTSFDILSLPINDRTVDYLYAYIRSEKAIKEHLDDFQGLLMGKIGIFIFYAVMLYYLIYAIGSKMLVGIESAKKFQYVDTLLLDGIYKANPFLFIIMISSLISFIIYFYLKHKPFYSYQFSQQIMILKYKTNMLLHLFKKYEKKKNRKTIGFLPLKSIFEEMLKSLKEYFNEDEINNLLFFNENTKSKFEIQNKILKGEIINDFNLLEEYQKKDVYKKIEIFESTFIKVEQYMKMLDMSFKKEFQGLKNFIEMIQTAVFILILIIILAMIGPTVLSLV